MIKKLKQLWTEGQEMQGAATLLMATMLLSNILGLLRDMILANTNKLSDLDRYYAAFRLPDFLFNLFILGAISAAFIPVFLDVKEKKGQASAWDVAQNLMHVSLFALLVLGIVLFIFMPSLLPYFIPGFSPEKIAATVPLARILLFSPIFFSVSYIIGAVLNAQKKFFAYALAPLVYNLSIIVGGFLSPHYGIQSVAYAVIIGAILHALVQIPTIVHLGFNYRFVFNLRDHDLRRILRLMIPRSVSLGMTQLVLVFFTFMGSFLPSGSVSIFTLTNNFQTTPTAIFAAAIGTAVFPLLGEAKTTGNMSDFKRLLTSSLQGMFFYMIPSMALLWVLRAHLMRLFLALNHQTWPDTIRAINTFGWFIIALAAQGFILIMIRAYYAEHDTRRPMYLSLIGGILSIFFAWFFINLIHDVPALALGFAIGTIVESIILFIVFQIYYPNRIDVSALLRTILAATGLSLISAVLTRLALSVVSEGTLSPYQGLGTQHIASLFVALLIGGVVGIGSYILLALWAGRTELVWIWPKTATKTILFPEGEEVAGPEGLK